MKRKRSLYFATVILLIFTMFFPSYASTATPTIKVMFRGEQLTLDHKPVSEAGVVLVPMKSIFDSFDAKLDFNSKTKTLTAIRRSIILKLTQGSKDGFINGKPVKLPIAPKLVDKQLFVPLDFVCKSFGFDFNLNKITNTITISVKDIEQKGNTSGNISNYGYTVASGDWTYISLYNAGLFKMKEDGSKKKKLSDDAGEFLNISGDWIYYVNSYDAKSDEKLRLYKMKTDGSSKTKLTKAKISYLNISGDWLFYINDSDNNKPYKMRLDGKGIKKLSNDSLQNLIVEDGWIYFQKEDDKNIYRMRTSGFDVKKLADDASSYGSYIIKSQEWIYYCSYDGINYAINKMNVNGKNKKSVIEGKISAMNLIDESIYYTDYKGNLYKLNENDHSRTKIGYGIEDGYGLNATNDWLYYSIYSEDDDLSTDYRIQVDGLIKQKFNQDGSFSDILRLSANENLPVYIPKTLSAANSSSSLLTAKEIAKHKDAVVHIKIFDDEGNVMASGSGFNIEEGGVIATNFHVISGASSIKCTFDNKSSYDVDYILNYNQLKDIALLHLKDAKDLPVVNLWDSDKVELAEGVLAIGNPLELQNTVSDGIISGIRTFWGVNYIQTTASISPGSSGGPLFNMNGNVVGITSMSINGAQNINFAVPINYVKKLYQTAHVIQLSTVNNYDSELTEFENNDNMLCANEFIPNQTIAGNIKNVKDIDYYKFTLDKDQKISLYGTFNTSNEKENTSIKAFDMRLINSDGTELAKASISTEDGDYSVQKISTELKQGDYYIVIRKVSTNKADSQLQNYTVLTVSD